jgi:hypothetical protein
MKNQIQFQHNYKRTYYRLRLQEALPTAIVDLYHASKWVNGQKNLIINSFLFSGFNHGLGTKN